MVYEAVIFDLDGTLVHTSPEHRYILVGQVLKDLNSSSSEESINRFWFESGRNEIIKNHFKVNNELFWEIFRKYDTVELRMRFTSPYTDACFIKELKGRGYKTGIVTGSPSHIAELEVGMLDKENFDKVVVAHSTSGITPKPHPHGLEECLDLIKVKKQKAVYVGNSEEDILTAKNAGVLDVLINRREHNFPDIYPSLIINSLYDLRQLLNIK